ncbi:MAG: hypothetical protein ACE5GE_02700 [Phycisphaerae bacterium]
MKSTVWLLTLCAWAAICVGCANDPKSDASGGGAEAGVVDQETGATIGDEFAGGESDVTPPDQPPDPSPGAPLPENGVEPPADGPVPPGELPPDNPDDGEPAVWSIAFDASGAGALSAVWGNAPDDVFVVGGTPAQGEVYHYDGTVWRAMEVPDVPLLVWVYGFGPDNVLAVGVGGGAVRYDGVSWTKLDSGTTEDLWGVWGAAPDDVWIVGGDVGLDDANIFHFDGESITPVSMPENDREATSLFKVWGIGSKVFAVGERGLILQYEDGQWFQVPAGANADEDFVALWGTGEDNIVAVGGRSGARIGKYDGTSWQTFKPSGIPGLNAVCMIEADEAVVGGVEGYTGSFDPGTETLTDTEVITSLALHGAWADGSGRYYAVGGRFRDPYEGVALVRTFGAAGIDVQPPLGIPVECVVDGDCSTGRVCDGGDCVPVPGCSGSDDDGDGWLNSCDNCISVANATQADNDGDGLGDACDACPGSADADDADGDGVPDGCDQCIGGDDGVDTDNDGVANFCDVCVGFDDNTDADGDGVADGCDACPGFNDADDADGDDVPDGCDVCAGGDDTLDADVDTIPDFCDVCPGFDDRVDADTDGVPDGCDACPGFNDAVDVDSDGVPDACDICAGGDDKLDSDNDSVPNFCDICPGFDDFADADTDGIPNGCDICEGSNAGDADSDGVPDACDVCPGADDLADADTDGVPDACDICAGFDDLLDADGDGVPDGCDICPGFDDAVDADTDGTPDGCDPCPLDNPDDTDSDGICDSNDICAGFDDTVDTDSDGVPDGCDACPGFDDGMDADADGVADGCDACPGFPDGADADGDTVPDGCDVCPGFSDLIDSDSDGVPDGCDVCPGFDDTIDSDGNGIPDGCCSAEPDCLLGESCNGGFCTPATADIELGYGDPYIKIAEGGDMPMNRGFQGFGELFLSYRTTGYTPGGNATISLRITLVADGTDVLPDTTVPGNTFVEISPGVNEKLIDFWLVFRNPNEYYGMTANVFLTITDETNPTISVSIQQTVVIVNPSAP